MKEYFKSFFKEEKASATILEYTIILPLIMSVVFILIFTGYIQHQKAVIESATIRGAIMASRDIVDPNYSSIVKHDSKKDDNDISSITIDGGNYKISKPYRYLFRSGGEIPSSKADIVNIITSNQLFASSSPEVSVKEVAGIFRKIIVSAKQEYTVPVVLPSFELPSFVTIQSQSTVYVNEPAEFIRNADFAIDLVQPLVGDIVTKINATFKKVSFFNKEVK